MVAPMDSPAYGLLPAGKEHPEDAQGCQHQPLHPRGGSGTAGTGLRGPRNGLFKGLSQRDTWRIKATLSVVTQEPHVPTALSGHRLPTGSEPSDAAQQTHSASFLEPHPGKLSGSLLLRAS